MHSNVSLLRIILQNCKQCLSTKPLSLPHMVPTSLGLLCSARPVRDSDEVGVHYVGRFADTKKVFDSSRDRGKVFGLRQGHTRTQQQQQQQQIEHTAGLLGHGGTLTTLSSFPLSLLTRPPIGARLRRGDPRMGDWSCVDECRGDCYSPHPIRSHCHLSPPTVPPSLLTIFHDPNPKSCPPLTKLPNMHALVPAKS